MASFTINAILGHSPPKEDKVKDFEEHDVPGKLTTDAFGTGLCLSCYAFLLSGALILHCFYRHQKGDLKSFRIV